MRSYQENESNMIKHNFQRYAIYYISRSSYGIAVHPLFPTWCITYSLDSPQKSGSSVTH